MKTHDGDREACVIQPLRHHHAEIYHITPIEERKHPEEHW